VLRCVVAPRPMTRSRHKQVAVCCSVVAVWLQCGCGVLRCVVVYCGVLQILRCVAVCCCTQNIDSLEAQAGCSVLQCVAVCCGVLQCVAVCCSMVAVCCCVAVWLHFVAVCCGVLQCVAVCCVVLWCVVKPRILTRLRHKQVAVYCSVVAVCCSVL